VNVNTTFVYMFNMLYLRTLISTLFFLFRDKNDDAGQNKTVKPSAFMKIYKGSDDISGQVVQLGDTLRMVIQLDDEYIGK